MIKSLFRKAPSPPSPRVPDGLRVYAIGDIHGCDDAFARLLALIAADDAARPARRRVTILLGDLVDRGPNSADVMERALRLSDGDDDARVIAGNHEELLQRACRGETDALRVFARNGGRETALSYGIGENAYNGADFDELARLLDAAIPAAHHAFLSRMEDAIVIGDYAFVHAGIRPGVALADQTGADLRWIRDRFRTSDARHEKFIVHGHTITETVDEQPNRLGIDTGAYATGRLTAVGLEADRRWFLQT